MKLKKLVIVGGGIAGLSAGIFALKNEYEAVIVEKHSILGGQCTGWDRKGYHIDGCIHWLVGTKENTKLRELWNVTGALENVEIYHPDTFLTFEHKGLSVSFYKDLEKLESSWIKISNQDEKIIKEMCSDIRILQTYEIPTDKPMDLMSLKEKISFIMSLKDFHPIYQKYSKMTTTEFANKFQHEALREAILSFIPDMDFSALSIIFPLSTFSKGQSSIPMGGSRALAFRMRDKFLSLGGKIITNTEIVDVEIKNKKVTKLITQKNEEITGDEYIFAIDAKALFDKILKNKYRDKKFEMRFNHPKIYPLASNIYVSVAYKGTMNDIPRTLRFEVGPSDMTQNLIKLTHLQMTHYGYEKDFAKEGHSVMTFAINQFEPELKMWQELAKDQVEYQRKKNEIGQFVIQETEKRFPEMKGKLTLLDVATPKTYERYCNAYMGAFMAFWPTTKGKQLISTGKIKGIKNMVLTGQWVQPPGGLPVSLLTGKDTIMRQCKKDKKGFKI